MEKFIFYKGKYYTKQDIKNILSCNYFYKRIADISNKNHESTLDIFNCYLDEEKSRLSFDILLIILVGVIGIKIGTLL